MRLMKECEAEMYIKAGFFPRDTDIEAICDLQDAYGHQRYWACINWLMRSDTALNAEKLFRLIWHEDDVNRMLDRVQDIRDMQEELASKLADLARLQLETKKLNEEVIKLRNNMKGEQDYYDNPADYDKTEVDE